jgi:ribosomal-protein-alanine N-acetyltransferase
MIVWRTPRLELIPVTFSMVEAVMLGRRSDAEALADARMPEKWPNPELIERAFTVSLEAIRADPEGRLWGARVMIARGEPSGRYVVGSIVFAGPPGDDGAVEMAYGIEEGSQGRGYATEAVRASVAWAFEQPGVRAVRATTFGWHRPSLRVIEKVGMVRVGVREHETMGELVVFEVRRDGGTVA